MVSAVITLIATYLNYAHSVYGLDVIWSVLSHFRFNVYHPIALIVLKKKKKILNTVKQN
jgi:hypothetical protein